MAQKTLSFHHVDFSYETSPEPLFGDISFSVAAGWTGVIGSNGAGKTTLLSLAAGILFPLSGSIQGPRNRLYCEQRTDDPPPLFREFLFSPDKEAWRIKTRLGIEDDWPDRWETLSHGERKRSQIGVALWKTPDVLAVDEPANHLDRSARKTLISALSRYRGIGLIVSHDRELLDTLTAQCLFLYPDVIIIRPGGISRGMEQEEREEETARKKKVLAGEHYKRLKREAAKRREKASRQQNLRSKRGLAPKDHDARFRKNLARLTGKDGVGGKLLRQIDGRLKQAEKRDEDLSCRKREKRGITIHGSFSHRDVLFHLPPATLSLGTVKRLEVPRLFIYPQDRIALIGDNGTGKSTLIRMIVSSLSSSGLRFLYIPQEISKKQTIGLLFRFGKLPDDIRGRVLATISRLGSVPGRLLDTYLSSPGESRKLMLALGLTNTPELIIMDEPTNHMDIVSVRCLETSLTECGCALLLASHDMAFLDHLAVTCWRIDMTENDRYRLVGK
ncbi:MAG: ABC-F family ATP-binding cassette domain-containing protein [Spirochaetales bacterium]|nr:ABC-F family ATP-binding cassette domain-containing protein [Spirochaetales bacterium]